MVWVTALAPLLLAGAYAPPNEWVIAPGPTGNQFMDVCGANWQPGFYDGCGSFILGIVDTLAAERIVCLPPGIEIKQVQAIGYEAIRSKPDQWQKAAHYLISRHFKEKYPCR